MKVHIVPILLSALLSAASCSQRETETKPVLKYEVIDGSISGHNTGLYNNRPLYINNTNAFILTGDQPLIRLAKDQNMYGTLVLGIEHAGKGKWLYDCTEINSFFDAGKMGWEISDSAFPGIKIRLDVLPMAGATGMAVKAVMEGADDGDRLIWAFGASRRHSGRELAWALDVMVQPKFLKWGFVPAECRNNTVNISGKELFLSLPDTITGSGDFFKVAVSCSNEANASAGDASSWNNPASLSQSGAGTLPILNGHVQTKNGEPVYFAFEAFNKDIEPDLTRLSNPEKSYADGLSRIESFKDRLKINTPDPYLDAAARASVAAVDGTWYPPVFVHGAMAWSIKFPGWRTIFGGTMYGWHDRVKDEARYYIDSQVTDSLKKEAIADPKTLLTEQHPDSRFYGRGHIQKDQAFYNMQTQFFDQIVEEYRWSGDPELITFFRKALDLHLEWVRDCFDPDGDGVYESYINVWPTDSQWYNGGGTAEETSYAYRGHLAARDMARAAGDRDAEDYHNRMLEKIRKGFFEKLWIPEFGYSASYIEQGGHERRHDNPWLYSIFLPVDAGLTSDLQSIESTYYSEWALQNDTMPSGGRKVWTSNWMPHVWSIRELWPGDNYHLALAYYRAGLPEEAWDIMKGTFMHSAFNFNVPGNIGDTKGGTDFGDCVHTFARTLVSGLFGFIPDYPNGKVRIIPQFPSHWDHASLATPDFSLDFERKGNNDNYSVSIAREAALELLLPVSCEEVTNVSLNGKEAEWELIPSPGRSIVKISVPASQKAEVRIRTGKRLQYYNPVKVEGNKGQIISLDADNGVITGYEDPQEILSDEKIENGVLKARLSGKKGFHTVIAKVNSAEAPQLRVFRLKINDPEGDAREAARYVKDIPATASWKSIVIEKYMNADVTGIFRQKYLSPRPNTVSCRLGTDGYSPWTFWHWKSPLPEINLRHVTEMLDEKKMLKTPQGVPFRWPSGRNNIVFTSMWDNYPSNVIFPVGEKGDAVYFLVCGSTNVMQCQIANAVLRLNYADGTRDSLELIPPVNYWNLSVISSTATSPEQDNRADYLSETDRFCLPAVLPERVQLGDNCRAMLLNMKLKKDTVLESITLETLSQEVVVGIIGITIMKSQN